MSQEITYVMEHARENATELRGAVQVLQNTAGRNLCLEVVYLRHQNT